MIRALGVIRVTTPGTPVSVMTLLPADQQTDKLAWLHHAFFFQPLPTNSGFMYVGDAEAMDKDTFANCMAWLPIPTVNSAPAFSGAHTIAPNGLTLQQYWVDADVAEDAVLVTVIVT